MIVNQAVEQIRLLNRFRCSNPVPEDAIAAAEQRLQSAFAPDYRASVAAFGRVTCFGHELTGISDARRLDVVEVTERHRAESKTVPSTWYVIEELHIDDVCAWQSPKGDVYFVHPCGEPSHVADTLLDYLKS